MLKTLQDFKDNIGKRVYRKAHSCGCHTCADVTKRGLVIYDENHAQYLYECSSEFQIDYFIEPITK